MASNLSAHNARLIDFCERDVKSSRLSACFLQ
jgi:hypothetical protein